MRVPIFFSFILRLNAVSSLLTLSMWKVPIDGPIKRKNLVKPRQMNNRLTRTVNRILSEQSERQSNGSFFKNGTLYHPR